MRNIAMLTTSQLSGAVVLARLKTALLTVLVCGVLFGCVFGLRLYYALSVTGSI